MQLLLIGTGLVCLVAAIAGAAIKSAVIEIDAIASPRRQALLAVLGVVLLAAGWFSGGAPAASGDLPGGQSQTAVTLPTGQPSAVPSDSGPTASESTSAAPVAPGDLDPASVVATSELTPQAGSRYDAQNLLDGDGTTAWCEGTPDVGLGQEVQFQFAAPVTLQRVSVVNGYGKGDRFESNARARDVQVITSDRWSDVATLRDDHSVQDLPVPPTATTSYTVRIVSAYPGSRFSDLCLSDLDFYGSASG